MTDTDLRDRAARAFTAVRRGVLGRRRSLAFVCASGAVLAGLRVVAPPPPDTVAVLVATRDLPAGAVIGRGDVELRHVPPELDPDGVLEARQVLGRTVAAPLRRGEAVTDARVVSESLLDGYPGMVAVPVRIPDPGAVGLLVVGDRVDVLAADPGEGAAETVAADAVVIALPHDDPDAPVSGTVGVLGGRLVVLGVPEVTALDLAGRAAGGVLSLAISR